MPCMGPTYSDEQVDKIYNKFVEILKNEHHFFCMPFFFPNGEKLRAERLKMFRDAIEGLVELNAWEGF